MRKFVIIGSVAVCLLAAQAAFAVVTPDALKNNLRVTAPPKVELATSTSDVGIKIPWQGASIIFDPGLLNATTTPMPTPKPLPVPNPDMFNNLEPLIIPPILIPTPKANAPQITDIQISSDGKILKATWKTDQETTSKIEYGLTTDYGKALEDKTFITEHAVAIPVVPGALHIRLSSANPQKLVTQTPDVALAIPEIRESVVTTPTTTTEVAAQEDESATPPAQTSAPVAAQPAQGMTVIQAVIGGAVLLILGLIAGALFSRRKPQA